MVAHTTVASLRQNLEETSPADLQAKEYLIVQHRHKHHSPIKICAFENLWNSLGMSKMCPQSSPRKGGGNICVCIMYNKG